MWAERAAAKIDRDYDKAIRKMNEIKDSMDRAQLRYDAREEGHAEGRAEGEAKGRQEGKAETARNLKLLGVSMDLIIKSTGLSQEEIARL